MSWLDHFGPDDAEWRASEASSPVARAAAWVELHAEEVSNAIYVATHGVAEGWADPDAAQRALVREVTELRGVTDRAVSEANWQYGDGDDDADAVAAWEDAQLAALDEHVEVLDAAECGLGEADDDADGAA